MPGSRVQRRRSTSWCPFSSVTGLQPVRASHPRRPGSASMTTFMLGLDSPVAGRDAIMDKQPKPESERAAERVSDDLETGTPEEELDPADAQRVAATTSSPQPPPDER